MLRHRDAEYSSVLSRDRRSGFTALLAIGDAGSGLISMLMLLIPGSHAHLRGNPLYWMLLIAFEWWGTQLVNRDRRVAWTLPFGLLAGPLLAGSCAIIRFEGGGNPFVWVGSAFLSLLFAVAGGICYRGSLLRRYGPAR